MRGHLLVSIMAGVIAVVGGSAVSSVCIGVSHHVSGRGGVFLEMLSVAMGGERGLVVVHLDETRGLDGWASQER